MDSWKAALGVGATPDGISTARLAVVAFTTVVSASPHYLILTILTVYPVSSIQSVDSSLQSLHQPLIQIPRPQTSSSHQPPQSILDLHRTKPIQTKRAPRQVRRRRQNKPYSSRIPKRPGMEGYLRPSQIRGRIVSQRSQVLHPRTEWT